MKTSPLIASLLLIFTSVRGEEADLPPPTHAELAYGERSRHRLDLWRAKSGTATALLIFIHGGGWAGGDKGDLPLGLLRAMLADGISVASINYRFSTETPLPAPVRDAARAVQFLRSKAADWNLDPTRFGAYGISAGATTTLWLACHDDLANPQSNDPVERESTRLQAAVALSPQTCLEPEVVTAWIGDQVLVHPMIGRAVGVKDAEALKHLDKESAALLREFSSLNHVSAGDPPMLISNPRVDPLPATTPGIAIHHAIFGAKLKEKADAAGVACILRIQDQPEATQEPEAFLIERLYPVR